MKTIGSDKNVFVDVDETLIINKSHKEEFGITDKEWAANSFPMGISKTKVEVMPHFKHIEFIKELKSKNITIYVWSAGGKDWAEAVIKALGLEDFVDFAMTKPELYIDDLEADKWMRRIWFKP